MGITAKNFNEFVDDLRLKAERIEEGFIDKLNYLALEAIRYIRDRSEEESWRDHTGNLRSSIGYILVFNGLTVHRGGFEVVRNGRQGAADGRRYAEELASKYPAGYALIVVAGMEYASYVEAMENKDVLASGKVFLEKKVKELTDNFLNNIAARK